MGKITYSFENFLDHVDTTHHLFFTQLHDFLTANTYAAIVELKKTGYALSYIEKGNKISLLNFVKRKSGIYIRLYANHIDQYIDIFDQLPDNMIQDIKKAKHCKRFYDPEACNPRCKKGYNIFIDQTLINKCRNSAFFFLLEYDKYEAINKFIKLEVETRNKVSIL